MADSQVPMLVPALSDVNSSSSGWQLDVSRDFDVLGPFPIHAREQHFLSPAFPLNLSCLVDFTKRWPSSYADGGEVSWSKRTMLEDGRILLSYPDVRWNQLRATEGWAALQHHSIIRMRLTVYPPDEEASSRNHPVPQLSMKLLRGSFFALLPSESHPSRTTLVPQWHTGDIYAMGGPPSLVQLPVKPTHDQPTSYDLFISADYEIRLFGDPRSAGSEAPRLDMTVKADLISTMDDAVSESYLNVICDFVDGYAFGEAIGVGVRSIAGWWTVTSARVVLPTDGISVHLLDDMFMLAPGQARVVPLRIVQSRPLDDIDNVEIELTLEHADMGVINRCVHLEFQQRRLSGRVVPFIASYFFASSIPTAFVVKRPLEPTPEGEEPWAPMLALHGAGVDVLSQAFWSDSLPTQKRSWIVMPTGRTPWGFDWHGPSAEDAWSTVSALQRILESRSVWLSWRLPVDGRVLVIGHSNGGQGAWFFASRWPDRVLAAIPAAAYIKAQAYVSLALSRSGHFIDPMLRAVLDTAYTPDDNDLFLSNVAHTPVWAIHGGDDDNVPTWHTREAVSVVKTWDPFANIRFAEDPGKKHFYPEIFQKEEVLDFMEVHLQHSPAPRRLPNSFTLTVASVAEESSLFGWKIRSLRLIGRLARLTVKSEDGYVTVTTSNVRAFSIGQLAEDVAAADIDGQCIELSVQQTVELSNGIWQLTNADILVRKHYRASSILNSAKPLRILIPDNATRTELSAAQRIAHGLQVFFKLDARISFASLMPSGHRQPGSPVENIIVIGSATSPFLQAALRTAGSVFAVDDATDGALLRFRGEGIAATDGAIFLHAHPDSHSAAMLVLAAEDEAAMERLVRLFPSRTGIAVPDWLIIRPLADSVGAAGIRSAGVWDEHWGYNEGMSWKD